MLRYMYATSIRHNIYSDRRRLLRQLLREYRIRKRVARELVEEQEGFRKGRWTPVGVFALRQLVQKRLGTLVRFRERW